MVCSLTPVNTNIGQGDIFGRSPGGLLTRVVYLEPIVISSISLDRTVTIFSTMYAGWNI